MKGLPLFIIVFCALSCELVDGPVSMGNPHGRRPYRSAQAVSDVAPGIPKKDTIIYMTAMSYPEDYRWSRDSGIGYVKADILLYRNFEPVLSVPVGGAVSADADRHHVVGGHLVTQSCTYGQLQLCMDESPLFTFPESRELRGILFWDGNIYTLVANGGGGFCLRKGEEVLLRHDSGILYGSLTDPSCPDTGALYLDGSSPVFCYAVQEDGQWCYYSVRDAVPVRETGPGSEGRAMDMKIAGARAFYALESMNACSWKPDSRVWMTGPGAAAVCGDACLLEGGSWSGTIMDTYDYSMRTIGPSDGDLYAGAGGAAMCVLYVKESGVRLYVNGMPVLQPEGRYSYISPLCAALAGSTPVLALSPRSDDLRPSVIVGSKRKELEISGFVTSIRITINNK